MTTELVNQYRNLHANYSAAQRALEEAERAELEAKERVAAEIAAKGLPAEKTLLAAADAHAKAELLRSTIGSQAERAETLKQQIIACRIAELREEAARLEAEADRAEADAFPHFARACAALGLPEPPRAAIQLLYRRIFLPSDPDGIEGQEYPPRDVWARPVGLRARAEELRRKAERLEARESSRAAELRTLISG